MIIFKCLSVFLVFIITGCATADYQPGLRPTARVAPNIVYKVNRVNGVKNVNLFYQSWHPKKNSKAVIIFVHGLKDHGGRYREIAEKLALSGYASYAYDHRGLGDSGGQRVWVSSFEDYIADLEIIFDVVRMSEPNQPIYLFGHSMGGTVASLFAVNKLRPIKGLVLSAPAFKVTTDVNGFMIGVTKVLGTMTPSLAILNLKDEAFTRDQDSLKELKADPLVFHGNAPARTAKELLKAMHLFESRMNELQLPFLALHGEKDLVTNPEGSKELYQKAASTNKTLKLYPALYHDLFHEPEKELVFNDFIAWLKQQ